MGSNFNLVQKPKKEENEFDDDESEDIELEDVEEEEDDDDSSKGSKDVSRKKLYIVMCAIMGCTAILLLVLYIVSLVGGGSYEFEEIETILSDAAKSYFKTNPESLPQEDGYTVEIDSTNLVAAGNMKDLSEYTKDGVVCTGSVQVTKAGNDYIYTPILNCGDSYLTIKLSEKVLTDNDVVNSGDGLYSNDGNYTFRGENVNNYVQLENGLWRVVKVTSDDNVVLIHDSGVISYQPWDDRYNEDRLFEAGINNYSVSRIKDYLDKIYSNPVEENDEYLLSDSDKSKIITFDQCIGKRSAKSETKNNKEECKQTVKNQKLGLLTLSDYMYASLDSNCKSASSRSCMNYNYLSMNSEWWLATACSDSTSTVFKVDRSGVIKVDNASAYSKVRPVIYLNSNAMFKSGKGTLEEPYIVK